MDAVFFDIDDTLYDQAEPFARAVRAVVGKAVANVSDDALYRSSRTHSTEVFAAFGRGEHPTMACYVRRMRDTLADFGVNISDCQARRMQLLYAASGTDSMSLSSEMERSLAWCSEHVTRGLGCVSNGRRAGQLAKIHAIGCDRWISDEHVVTSEELGIAKPDSRIFQEACSRLGARPGESLFVGDSYDIDVTGARGVGMPVIWFDRRHKEIPDGLEGTPGIWIAFTDEEVRRLLERLVR